MLTTLEGVYKDGRVELEEVPAGIADGRVLVTFLPNGLGWIGRELGRVSDTRRGGARCV